MADAQNARLLVLLPNRRRNPRLHRRSLAPRRRNSSLHTSPWWSSRARSPTLGYMDLDTIDVSWPYCGRIRSAAPLALHAHRLWMGSLCLRPCHHHRCYQCLQHDFIPRSIRRGHRMDRLFALIRWICRYICAGGVG